MTDQINKFIDNFNTAWTKGKLEELETLLDERVIFVAPDLSTEIIGKEACFQTLHDYVENVNTIQFKVLNNKVHRWEETASVSIDYYIEYELNDQLYKENGKEFWTLVKQQDYWRLVWRAMVKNEPV